MFLLLNYRENNPKRITKPNISALPCDSFNYHYWCFNSDQNATKFRWWLNPLQIYTWL